MHDPDIGEQSRWLVHGSREHGLISGVINFAGILLKPVGQIYDRVFGFVRFSDENIPRLCCL